MISSVSYQNAVTAAFTSCSYDILDGHGYNTMRFHFKTVLTILAMSGMVFVLHVLFKTISVTTSPIVSLIKVYSPGNVGNENITDPLLKAARKIGSYSRTLLVPVINNAYLPFAYNWLCHTQEMGLHKSTLIVTTDDKTRDKLLQDWPNVSAESMNITTLSGNQTYGHAGFLKVNAERHRNLYRLLQEGYEILHFDLDQIWLANPLPVLQGYAHLGYDAMFLKDGSQTHMACSGFIYIWNTVKSVKLWYLLSKTLDIFARDIYQLKDLQKIPKHMSDQRALNELILKNAVKDFSYKLLPTNEFAAGVWYNKLKAEQEATNPYVIHNNWIIGNTAKIERAKRFNHWFLKEDMKCNMDLVHKVIRH